ncbi:proline-rich basic protein 1 [Mesocricetus auratus]|uniref:Proline-rich basic protein 1 n=1 Tax=Mesocricetus auratus TaxID=10036 RepID=A0A1U7Q616_MESAU|nr:proline-rich basic protein 1 [Mesocricetus auratus]
MLTALAPPALPGLSRRPPAPTRRQDSSGSSGSYHTAPGSPESPDVGPDAEGQGTWLWVAPGRGAGAQPVLSVSAQNSLQQHWSGSGFPRGPGSGPQPPRPQLRMLPSGEMEVIFGAGPLFSRSDDAEGLEEPQLTAPAFSSPWLPGSASPASVSPPPPPPAPDRGVSRWATYLELPPRGPSPAVSGQYECVEVALEEERAAPARPRTVPKRQIELRPRPRSPPQDRRAPPPPSPPQQPPRPRLLLRTGSLDESLSRLQAAAGIVQTALARKLGSAVPAPGNVTVGSSGKPEPTRDPQETARSTRAVRDEATSRPPRPHDSSVPARAPRPWPSLRERAIRRDRPAPGGTEPLGPVSSSVFLQTEEKVQPAHQQQEPKTQPHPRETPDRTVPRAPSPPFHTRSSRVAPGRLARPRRSPSPPRQAPDGAARGRCASPAQNLSRPPRTVWRVSGPSCPEASSSEWGDGNEAVEEALSPRSPSPPPLPQRTPGVIRVGNPGLETPSPWKVSPSTGGDATGPGRDPSPPALLSGESPEHPTGTSIPPPRERSRGPTAQGPPTAATRQDAANGLAREAGPPTPPAPGTPELAEEAAQRPLTTGNANAAHGARRRPPEPPGSHPPSVPNDEDDACPEAPAAGDAASERPRVTVPRPRDVRKMVKTTYAPSFPAAGAPGRRGLPAPPPPDPVRGEEGDAASQAPELPAPESPAPAHYMSVFLKDFLPVVPHPYESPEPSLHASPPDAPQTSGVPRRRAENSTAKPFARSEIRLPGALARSRPPREETAGVRGGHSPAAEKPDTEEAPLGVPDLEGRTSPAGGARASTQRPPSGSAGTQPLPRPGSPQARRPSSSLVGAAPESESEAPLAAPATVVPAPQPREPPATAGRTAAPLPRAASAPPTERAPPASPLGMARRPPGAAPPPPPPGKILVDPQSGRYYLVEAPRQPRLRLLFDPESGQYVEVLLPPSPSLPRPPPRQAYSPPAPGPGLYPPAYGPIPGSSLSPPSPNLPPLGSLQPPWAPEAGALEGMYYVPWSGTPSPAPPPMLFCAPASSCGPIQSSKGSVFPL